MKTVLSFLIKLYRKFVSPLKAPCCRFYPTCSTYALEALEEWGAIRGTFLTLWRILRCNPFCRGGIDEVPKRTPSRKMTAERISYRGRKPRSKNEDL